MNVGKCIRLGVLGAWMIGQGKLEAGKKEGPAGLSGVQAFGRTRIFEVLVVGVDDKWVFGPLELVSPLLQG